MSPGTVAHAALEQRQAVVTSNLLLDPRFAVPESLVTTLERAGHGAVLAVPLLVHDAATGVLAVAAAPGRVFDEEDVRLAHAFADQAAVALENARLYADAQARERKATQLSRGLALLNDASSALHRTLEVNTILEGVLDGLRRDVGAAAALVLHAGDDGALVRRVGLFISEAHRRDAAFPGSEELLGAVRTRRQPVLLRSGADERDIVHRGLFEHGVRSVAAFPLVAQRQRMIGVLVLSYTTAQDFPEHEVRLLSAYADQLAMALENAQLYDEARTQRERLTHILDGASDGVVFVGARGRVEAANRRAAELLGLAHDRLVGADLGATLTAATATSAEATPLGLLAAGRAGEGDLTVTPAGRILHWVARPTLDGAGEAMGLTLTLQDVTKEREVSRMKTDSVSFVTHQLRTPLAGITWMLELAGEAALPPEIASHVEDARGASERLISLVNDLLDVSRLERGKLEVEVRPTDLVAVTREVLAEVQPLATERGHQLAFEVVGTVPFLPLDPSLTRQALLNLVSNAIKYTPPGGSIEITVARRGPAVAWRIRDSGIGIPREAQHRLFEKFYRADNAFALETEGTGLGLYIVRLIVERFGGRVSFESDTGCGSTFQVTLPLTEPAP